MWTRQERNNIWYAFLNAAETAWYSDSGDDGYMEFDDWFMPARMLATIEEVTGKRMTEHDGMYRLPFAWGQ